MSDVIWAAIIAVGGSGTTGMIAYRATLAQTGATIATARSQAEVELAKVRAELDRLREQHREDERRNRQGTYHRLLAVLDRFDTMGTGFHPSDEQFEQVLAEFNHLTGAVRLFGA